MKTVSRSVVPDSVRLKKYETVIHEDGTWVKFSIRLLYKLSGIDVLLLSELMNTHRIIGTLDWIPCSEKRIFDRISFKGAKQSRVFSRLVELDLISITRKGITRERFAKVDYENVLILVEECRILSEKNGEKGIIDYALSMSEAVNQIDKAEIESTITSVSDEECGWPEGDSFASDCKNAITGESEMTEKKVENPTSDCKNAKPEVAKMQPHYIKEVSKNIKNKLSPSPKSDEPRGGFFDVDIQREKDEADIFSERLYDLLSEKRLIFRRPSLKAWATEIRGFINLSGYSPDEIDSVLNWYKENVSNPYTPQAFSAKSFCEKFGRLFVMMNRPVVETQHERNLAFAEKLQQEAALKRREEEEEAKKPKELVYVDLFPKRKK